jgi:hypothetical protein
VPASPPVTPTSAIPVVFPVAVHREWLSPVRWLVVGLCVSPVLWIASAERNAPTMLLAALVLALVLGHAQLRVVDLDGQRCRVRMGLRTRTFQWALVRRIRLVDHGDAVPALRPGQRFSVAGRSAVRLEFEQGDALHLGVTNGRAVLAALLAAHKRARRHQMVPPQAISPEWREEALS